MTDRSTCLSRAAAVLQARPGEWIDWRDIASQAGGAAWRTRLSELRHPPYSMTVENRTIRHKGWTESRYRYRPNGQPSLF